MAKAGVRGGPGVIGVSRVIPDAIVLGVSDAAGTGSVDVTTSSERDKRLGLGRFMVKTGGSVVGDELTPLPPNGDAAEGGESFIVMDANPWPAPSSESARANAGRSIVDDEVMRHRCPEEVAVLKGARGVRRVDCAIRGLDE